jgi:PE family
MQFMSHDPAAAGIGEEVLANAGQGLTSSATVSPSVTGLAPAGAEEVSAQAATVFTSEGVETLASIRRAQEELQRAGAAIMEIAGMYSAVDDGAAATLA